MTSASPPNLHLPSIHGARQWRTVPLLIIACLCSSMACRLGAVLLKPQTPDLLTPTPWNSPTPTWLSLISPLPTIEPPTPMPYQQIKGRLFHDFNASGLAEPNEPAIPDVRLCVDLPSEEICTTSDAHGYFTLRAPVQPSYWLSLHTGFQPAYLDYGYINLFEGWLEVEAYQINGVRVAKQRLPQTRLVSIAKEIEIRPSAEEMLEIGLVQGFLTDIFPCGIRQSLVTYQGYDLEAEMGIVRHYYEAEPRQGRSTDTRTVFSGDNHFAYDWGASNEHIIGTPILAAANGLVTFAGKAQTWNGACNLVTIAHPEVNAVSGYVHLDQIFVKDLQEVHRGQLIGTLGMSCTTWPHVHFYFRPIDFTNLNQWAGIDPFRDLFNPASRSYWTVDNSPQCPSTSELEE